jgi:hypothetical protein
MKITAFVDRITSGFSRNGTVTIYTSVMKEMKDTTIPSLTNFIAFIEGNSKAEKVLDRFGKDFVGRLGAGKGKFLDRILAALNANVAQEGDVEDLIGKLIPKDADALSLDGRAANLVQYVEVLGFVNSYIRQLLLTFTADITKAVNGPKFDSGLAPSQVKLLQSNLPAFVAAMQALEVGAAGVERKLATMPEFNVAGSDVDSMVAAHGAAKMDPLRTQGFFSANWNPICAIRMLIADRLLARYNAAKEERQALEYRIQSLIDSQDGTQNPKLENAIAYHNGQLKRLNKEIADIEESV